MGEKNSTEDNIPESFSVTNVKLALDCPRLFYFNKYLGKKPFPSTGIVLGGVIHGIINKIVKKLRTNTRIAPFLTSDGKIDTAKFEEELKAYAYNLYYEKFTEFSTKFQTIDEIERNITLGWQLLQIVLQLINTLLQKAFHQYPSEEAFTRVFLANERSFKVKVPQVSEDFVLSGRFDSLWMDVSEGTVALIDFKTGPMDKIEFDYAQIAMYAYAVRQELQFRPRFSLFYLTPEKIEERKGTWEDLETLLPNIFKKMKEMRQWTLKTKNFPKTPLKRVCQYCHLHPLCQRHFPHDPPLKVDGTSLPDPRIQEQAFQQTKVTGKLKSEEQTTSLNPMIQPTSQQGEGNDSRSGSEVLEIGVLATNPQKPALLDVKLLNRHIAILGSPGCGKTVLAKVIVEELLLQGYSTILIDPQGDLCSLLLAKDDIGRNLMKNVNFKILTPGSKKGIPLTLDFFKEPAPNLVMDEEYLQTHLDYLSTTLLNVLGIDMKKRIPPEKPLLESIIRSSWGAGESLTFQELAEKVSSVKEITTISTGQSISVAKLISPREQIRLAQMITSLSVGTDGLLFSKGAPLDISDLLAQGPSCCIISLQGLGTDQNKRQLVLSWIVQRIYNWMLTHPQAEQDALRLLFYIDEVADFLPIHPHNPPSKKLLSLLIRQARKYGVGVMLATQSPGSIEYKIIDDVNTLFIGKIPTTQSAAKIENLISPYMKQDSTKLETAMQIIRTATPGQFFVVHPGGLTNEAIQVRQLHSKHETIALERIPSLQTKETI
ncbi:MAG: AAA ATPase [Promethearchaeota archaeon CR_4]|nr:MAG: AAA ATPase [Candidatus Lokiarchaeota archaeon CR_4]